MSNQAEAQRGRQLIESGRKVQVSDLAEGDEILGVGVMEADPGPVVNGLVRLYVAGGVFDKRADLFVTVG